MRRRWKQEGEEEERRGECEGGRQEREEGKEEDGSKQ